MAYPSLGRVVQSLVKLTQDWCEIWGLVQKNLVYFFLCRIWLFDALNKGIEKIIPKGFSTKE